ncbi:MAG: hypothetical protein QW587_05320 [Candidatus Bathyarchaeia archaeon]
MERLGLTASTLISFAEKLEEDASRFYERLADAYLQGRETFLAFAEAAKRSRALISRTYQETVSDAIETGFSFEDLDLNEYAAEAVVSRDWSYVEALKAALELEEKAARFYSDVAERSRSLLATMPRAFVKIAQERAERGQKLARLLSGQGN